MKGKNLFYVFVDLEKAFDRLPQKVIWYALRKRGVPEYLVQGMISLDSGCETAVSIDGKLYDFFLVSWDSSRICFKPVVVCNVYEVYC